MTDLDGLVAALDATGLPLVQGAWPDGGVPALPYLCLVATASDPFFSGGRTAFHSTRYDVELYSERRDLTGEGAVQAALGAAGTPWRKALAYIASERMNVTTWSVSVVGG